MPAKTTTYTTIAGLNKALRKLPKEASTELRNASLAISRDIAKEAAGRARSQGGLAALVAPSIKAKYDRVPAIKMGSTAKLPEEGSDWTHSRGGSRQTIGDVIWGAEFGGKGRATTQQFMEHRGTRGYFLWPTVRDNSDEMQDRYSEALLDALGDIK